MVGYYRSTGDIIVDRHLSAGRFVVLTRTPEFDAISGDYIGDCTRIHSVHLTRADAERELDDTFCPDQYDDPSCGQAWILPRKRQPIPVYAVPDGGEDVPF